MKIAIDGTAASGKGTLSILLSEALKIPRLDTGLLYRKVAYIYKKTKKKMHKCDHIDDILLKSILDNLNIEDLDSELLKQDLYGNFASIIGKLDFVRKKLKIIQIEFVENMTKQFGGCILDGRDIGSNILPDADFKFYIDAPIKIRAKRRFKQLYSKNQSINLKNILLDIEKRDFTDKTRKNSPLIFSNDYILINTEFLNPKQVLEKALHFIKKIK